MLKLDIIFFFIFVGWHHRDYLSGISQEVVCMVQSIKQQSKWESYLNSSIDRKLRPAKPFNEVTTEDGAERFLLLWSNGDATLFIIWLVRANMIVYSRLFYICELDEIEDWCIWSLMISFWTFKVKGLQVHYFITISGSF